MIDLSHQPELAPLGQVVRLFAAAAQHRADRFLIVGAAARDLILHHAHGLRVVRATADLDIAVAVQSWASYSELETHLVAVGAQRDERVVHRFSMNGWKIDVLPFGNVERDGVIVWPDTEMAMSVAGFNEASSHAIEVMLPGGMRVFVASLPAMLMLKLFAWEERHLTLPRHDAVDIATLIDSYAAAWNEDRLYEEADDLLQKFGYDNALAAAALLGRDTAAIARPATRESLQAILEGETSNEALSLATDMARPRVHQSLALLEAVLFGLQDTVRSLR